MERRMSQALAMRSTWMLRRVTQVRPCILLRALAVGTLGLPRRACGSSRACLEPPQQLFETRADPLKVLLRGGPARQVVDRVLDRHCAEPLQAAPNFDPKVRKL